jgi:MSHA biogenesis protein MshK
MKIGGIAMVGLLAWALPAQGNEAPSVLSDPTRPSSGWDAEAYSHPSSGPVLQSTIIAPGKRRAIINGRSLAVGDKVGGAVITGIRPYEVTLTQAGRETRLRLLPKLTKDMKTTGTPSPNPGGDNK